MPSEEVEDEEESEKKEEPMKEKGKVIITKPLKPSNPVFTMRSMKKVGKECSDVIFN